METTLYNNHPHSHHHHHAHQYYTPSDVHPLGSSMSNSSGNYSSVGGVSDNSLPYGSGLGHPPTPPGSGYCHSSGMGGGVGGSPTGSGGGVASALVSGPMGGAAAPISLSADYHHHPHFHGVAGGGDQRHNLPSSKTYASMSNSYSSTHSQPHPFQMDPTVPHPSVPSASLLHAKSHSNSGHSGSSFVDTFPSMNVRQTELMDVSSNMTSLHHLGHNHSHEPQNAVHPSPHHHNHPESVNNHSPPLPHSSAPTSSHPHHNSHSPVSPLPSISPPTVPVSVSPQHQPQHNSCLSVMSSRYSSGGQSQSVTSLSTSPLDGTAVATPTNSFTARSSASAAAAAGLNNNVATSLGDCAVSSAIAAASNVPSSASTVASAAAAAAAYHLDPLSIYPWMAMAGLITPHRKRRQTYTRHQTAELEREYISNRYLTRRRRIEISQSLNLSERQIKIWFQNRRMKEKREKDHAPSPRKGHK